MSIGRTILDCKLALCHLASDMKYAGAVYEARTYGSVRGMRRKPHPTRYAFVYWKLNKLRVDNNTFRAGYFNMNRLHGSALK